MIKFCKKCNSETERYKTGVCKPCNKAHCAKWNAANPEKCKARAKAWRESNPDNLRKVRERAVAWNAANPEKVKAALEARRKAKEQKKAPKQ